ncbi:hypothetical protein ACFQFC_36510 [Amorphoplanes digitatis]|uniref:Uncharacterized protein n=1 Tax=Actinoplanes digitatis TaxID=1868 RepID=A0A7W7MP15_9ACTN|nr:hypothetical protein [Actinoplanes digitatis]MBB4761663.1 hypothetical protein [Actinoplanes digitatis]GID90773.1 hypothetical protein Adi01nite_01850 [Actinoplanes digitatis]
MSEIVENTPEETPEESEAVLSLQETDAEEEDVQAHSAPGAAASTLSLAICA